MDRKQAVYGVVIAATAMVLIVVFHHLFKHSEPEAATRGPRIEAVRQAQPLPANDELDKTFQRPVRTLAIKKPPAAAATLASPTRIAEMQSDPVPLPPPAIDTHPVRTETLTTETVKPESLAQHVIRQIEKPPQPAAEAAKPIQLRRPPVAQRDDDDEPKRRNNDGICARDGGHKVTFRKRNGWESWRCVYPHRHRND